MKNFMAAVILVGLALVPLLVIALPSQSDDAPAAGPAYVGAEKCKMCHMAAYRAWAATGMSKAWDRVKEAPDKEKCYQCHTTGYGRPGGFVDPEKTPNLTGVQCETCHGAGGAHLALGVSNRDSEARRATINKNIQDCRACHNPHVPDKAAAARAAAAS
jgi:hypothetical protein